MNQIKALLINILTLSIVMLVLFAFIEIGVRIFGNQSGYATSSYPQGLMNPKALSGMNPDFDGKFKEGEFAAEIHTNQFGLRGQWPDYDPAKKKYLFLGDSFTFGHGVEDEDSYVSLLRSYNDSLQIANAGMPGRGPLDYERLYKGLFVKDSFDVVTLNLFLGNDIHWTMYKQASTEPKVTDNAKAESKKFDLRTFLRNYIHTYSFIVDRLKANPVTRTALMNMGLSREIPGLYVIQVLDKNITEAYKLKWEQVFKHMRAVAELSKDFRLIIVPTKEQVHPEKLDHICQTYGLDRSHYDVNFPITMIDTFASNHGIEVINLLDTLSVHHEEPLFFDIDPHFNEKGHLLSAEYLQRRLIK